MKYIISEHQYIKLLEQREFSPNDPFANPRTAEKYIQNQTAMVKDLQKNVTIHDLVNITSAALDGIPGVGMLASSIIDVAHSISYFTGYYLENDQNKKVENLLNGVVTLGAGIIPVTGNLVAMGFKKGLSNMVKMTPNQIRVLLGLKKTLQLSKETWKYSVVAFLYRISKGKILDILKQLGEMLVKYTKTFQKYPNVVKVLLSIQNTLNDFVSIAQNMVNPDINKINSLFV